MCVGFSTTPSCRDTLGILEHIPHGWGGITAWQKKILLSWNLKIKNYERKSNEQF